MLEDQDKSVRIITTLHGTDITLVGQDPSFQPITKFSIERSDGLSAVSEYLRKETYKAFGCSTCAVEVIPNFVDPAVYDRALYPPLLREQVGNKRKIMIHVSNFRPVKRVRDIVRIFARVQRELPSALVMVGDGPDRGAAEQEARDLGVAEHVYFLGKLDAVAPLLASADLFLLPSESESFGLSALEALACGVPVVCSNAGGLPEVVRDGVTGSLRPVGDVEGMAAAALAILGDRAKWESMSAAAAADARARFGQDEIVAQYERFYEGVLG
jgi:N-acetyl-alpha-D-glucosaminyl L-malate synthase BshA